MTDTWTCRRCGAEYYSYVRECIECNVPADVEYEDGLPGEVVYGTDDLGELTTERRERLEEILFGTGVPHYWDSAGGLVVPESHARTFDTLWMTIDQGGPVATHHAVLTSEDQGGLSRCEHECKALALRYLDAFGAFEAAWKETADQRAQLLSYIDVEESKWVAEGNRVLQDAKTALEQVESNFRRRGKGHLIAGAQAGLDNLDLPDNGVGASVEDAEDADTDRDLVDIYSDMRDCSDRVDAIMIRTAAGLPMVGKTRLIEDAQMSVAVAHELLEELKAALADNYKPYRRTVMAEADANERRARAVFESAIGTLDLERNALGANLDAITPSWSDPTWETWTPSDTIPQAVRIGQFLLARHGLTVTVPAVLALPGGKPLVFTTTAGRDGAIASVQALLLRLTAQFPPGKVRFTFIDPVGLGQSVAPLLHLADHDESLVGGKVWTEPTHIEARLADASEHIELVIQKYLRGQYKTIEEHNVDAGEVAEPYRVFVVLDFPQNFTDTAARRLASIVQNGPRSGVYPVIVANPSATMPYGFDAEQIYRWSTVIGFRDRGFFWDEEGLRDLDVQLEGPPELALRPMDEHPNVFTRVVNTIGRGAKDASAVEVSEQRLFGLVNAQVREQRGDDLPTIAGPIALDSDATWWTGNSSTGISAPLGRLGANSAQCLALGRGTAQHALVVGKTGSGKSTLLHALIVNTAVVYSPDELELYLIDFKKGVEFKPYAAMSLPHARVVAIESEREFGLSVLRGIDGELNTRGERFRGTTPSVDNISDYRQRTGQSLPRVLLVVDEFHELFAEDDRLATEAASLLDRIVRQGRAFGIHAVLGSQTLSGIKTVGRSTIDQIAVRIALQCSEADSRLVLADDNPAARLLARPGEAIYNASNGTVEGNQRFQVVWLPDDERDQYLTAIQNRSLFVVKREFRTRRRARSRSGGVGSRWVRE